MKSNFVKVLIFGVLVAGVALAVPPVAPEIDPGSMAVPFALIGGAVLIVRSRIRR